MGTTCSFKHDHLEAIVFQTTYLIMEPCKPLRVFEEVLNPATQAISIQPVLQPWNDATASLQ